MSNHLASGCSSCNRIVDRFRTLLALAGENERAEVPEPLAIRAKQIFSSWAPARLRTSARPFAALQLDSILQPALAGIRGQFTGSRQLLYKAGKYCLDVRQEREPGASKLALVGQLLDSDQPSRTLAGIPVLLLSRTAIVARALTSESGEFHFEYRPRKALTLVFGLDGQMASVDLSSLDIFDRPPCSDANGEHSSEQE